MNRELLSACKVKINDIKIIFEDGSLATIPSKNTFYMSIEKDYFNSFLPILNIKCLVNRELYTKINKNQPKFKIVLNKFFIPANTTSFDKSRVNIMYKNFINDVFINVNDSDSSPDLTESISEREGTNLTKRNDYEKDNLKLDLLLFTESSLAYRQMNSKIFKNCDIATTILALAQLTNQKQMLITYPDNRKMYNSECIITPNNLTFLGNVKFLQSVYGIYNHSYILFNDYDVMYLLDKLPNCTAYRKGELKRVYIEFNDIMKDKANIYGQYVDTINMRYMINCINTPVINTNSTSSNELLFDQLCTTNTYNGNTQTTDINMMKSTPSKTIKILDNKYNNDYIINSSAYDISINNYTVMTAFNEIDLDIMLPNKEYYLDIKIDKSEYKKINGLFKISKVMAVYEKQDDEIFKSVINAEFKRA